MYDQRKVETKIEVDKWDIENLDTERKMKLKDSKINHCWLILTRDAASLAMH